MNNYLNDILGTKKKSYEPCCTYDYKPKPLPLYERTLISPNLQTYKEKIGGNVVDYLGRTVGVSDGLMVRDGLGRSLAQISPGGMLKPPPTFNVPMFGHHP